MNAKVAVIRGTIEAKIYSERRRSPDWIVLLAVEADLREVKQVSRSSQLRYVYSHFSFTYFVILLRIQFLENMYGFFLGGDLIVHITILIRHRCATQGVLETLRGRGVYENGRMCREWGGSPFWRWALRWRVLFSGAGQIAIGNRATGPRLPLESKRPSFLPHISFKSS